MTEAVTKQVTRIRRALVKAATDPTERARYHRTARAKTTTRVKQALPRKLRGDLELPAAHLPDGPVNRPGLRVAVLLDPFSELAFRYEWDQVAPTPANWRSEFTARRPDLFFAESAWRGNDGSWRLAMTGSSGPSQDLRDLLDWCRAHGVPTVFWNKEDPPNYDRFIATARLFDHVFTVDADRLPDYRRDLGHDRVQLLPFGAQPRIHTPVRPKGFEPHRYDIAFAGSYFRDKHPERREQMDAMLPVAQKYGLHIFSRMQGEDERYQFPTQFQKNIVGTLPYPQMLAAAPAYKLFLNVNSVTRSPTMCARRLFELSAAQAPIVSGPAASIEPVFGDTVPVVTDRAEAETRIGVLMRHPELRDRQALLAHRRVFAGHLYRHRVDQVLETVGLPVQPRRRRISAVVPTMRPDQVDHVLATVAAQVHPDVELVLLTHGFAADEPALRARAEELGLEHLVVREIDAAVTLGAMMNVGAEAASGDYLAKMDDDNHYAPHYLSDLVNAFDYSEAQVVGKWAHFVHLRSTGATLLRFGHKEHRYVDLVQGGTLLMPVDVAREVGFEDLPRRVDTTFLDKVRARGGRVYSADRFNFVSVREGSPDGHTWSITDDQVLTRSSQLLFFGDPLAHATV